MWQYGVISKLALLVSAVICAIYLFRIQTPEQEKAGLTRCLSLPVSLSGVNLPEASQGLAFAALHPPGRCLTESKASMLLPVSCTLIGTALLRPNSSFSATRLSFFLLLLRVQSDLCRH